MLNGLANDKALHIRVWTDP